MKLPKSILLTILYYIFLELIGFWIILIPEETDTGLLRVSPLINALAMLILLVIVFRLIGRYDLLVFNKAKSEFYFFAIILGIGFVFFQSFLNIIYYQEISNDIFDYDFTLHQLTLLIVMTSILVIPITEELFFRKYIQGELAKNYKPYQAIFFASILFAFIHLPFISLFFDPMDFSFHQSFMVLFGGAISGILFYN